MIEPKRAARAVIDPGCIENPLTDIYFLSCITMAIELPKKRVAGRLAERIDNAEGSAIAPVREKSTLVRAFRHFGRLRALRPTSMKNQALQYYMHDGPTAFRFELAGNLNHEDARRLDQAWRTASSVIGDRRLIVDMTFVTNVDEQGRALITRWHRGGAQLIANSKASRALAESILGKPLPEPPTNGGRATVSDRTWLPFRASFRVRAVTLALLATIVFPVHANAAMLSPKPSPQQTREAVGGRFAEVARTTGVPASAEQLRGVSAVPSNKSAAFTGVN
jgi:hypothetical protein